MRTKLAVAMGVAGLALAAQASAQVTFYEGQGFRGRAFNANGVVDNLAKTGFNDRASSVVVERGRWEVCEHAHFQGNCVVLRPGSYDTLAAMGMNNLISSVRPVTPDDASPDRSCAAAGGTELRVPLAPGRARLSGGRDVGACRRGPAGAALLGRTPASRGRASRGANIPGAIIGGVLGGVLGHQIGSGRGRDVATAGGAVAGAAIGANAGRDGGQVYSQDVQRCTNVSSSANPDYWDVTYNFRGVEHRVQLSAPPGRTIAVNGNGEPRG